MSHFIDANEAEDLAYYPDIVKCPKCKRKYNGRYPSNCPHCDYPMIKVKKDDSFQVSEV